MLKGRLFEARSRDSVTRSLQWPESEVQRWSRVQDLLFVLFLGVKQTLMMLMFDTKGKRQRGRG